MISIAALSPNTSVKRGARRRAGSVPLTPNVMWQCMNLEQPKSQPAHIAASIVRWAVIVVVAVCVSALGGFWWLVESMSLWEGTLMLLVLTAFAFNGLPEAGMGWFLNKEVLFIRLPVWLVNVVGYTLGIWVAT